MKCFKDERSFLIKHADGVMEPSVIRFKVRYRDDTTVAMFVDGEFVAPGKGVTVNRSGWMVSNVMGNLFFVPEERFNKYFEIVEEVKE